MGMYNDQEYGKSSMTSHEISDRDKAAKMLIIQFKCISNFVIMFKYLIDWLCAIPIP